MAIDSIRGQVIGATGRVTLNALRVEAWDRNDPRARERIAAADTDENGKFAIPLDPQRLRDLIDRQSSAFFKVFRGEQLIADTHTETLWSPRNPDVKVIIRLVDLTTPGDGQPTPPRAWSVQGLVTTENGRPITAPIEVWSRRLRGDVLLATGAADDKGQYTVWYDPGEPARAGLDVYVLVRDPRARGAEVARSDVMYDAGPSTTVNLTVTTAVSRPTEFERLLNAVQPALDGVPLHELDAKGVELVASQVRWDARTVAMAAQADRLSGGTGIPAEHYYALMRAGVPGDPVSLHRLTDATVKEGIEQGIANGVITSAHPIDTTLQIQQRESLGALRQLTPPTAISSLGDMLKLSLNEAQTNTFLTVYRATADQPDKLWTTLAERGFDAQVITRLQTEGQLGYLTRQNAPLIARLRGNAQVQTTEDLVRAGLYKESAWTPLIGADVPAGLTADVYAAGLAAQVNMSFPTLVTAEMVRRGELPIPAAGGDAQGEVAAFLRDGHGTHTIGVDPVGTWQGYAGLSAQGKQGARLVERLYQMSPSNEAMVTLQAAGLHSALQIASMPRRAFMERHGDAFPSRAQAELVYQKAQEIHTTVLNMTTMYLSYRSAPNVYAMTGTTARQQFDMVAAPGTPTLEELLGNMDYCACDACKSVLGPAAYFVELLQFIDVANVPAGTQNPIAVLLARRPDLQHMLLSCENTNIALPYIDLVNEVLEYYIAHGNLTAFSGFNMREDSATADLLADPEHVEDAAYVATKGAVFPPPLPFDMPLEALRLLMRAWDLTLADALRTFGSAADTRRERLSLNASELSILTDTTFRTLPEYFGQPANATIDQLNDAIAAGKTFCRTTEIAYEDLVDLLRTRFINPGAPLVPLLRALAVSLEQLQSWFTGVIDDNALKALLPAALDPAPYGGDVLAWLRTNRDPIMGLITLTDVGEEAQECSFAEVELRFALPDTSANRLTELAWWKFLRFVRLWRKLGWSIELMDAAMTAFLGMAPEQLTIANLDAACAGLVARLANFVDLTGRQSISTEKIADWLGIWDTNQTLAVRQERLARLLRMGTTDLTHFADITGIDPLADDMQTDAPSLGRFIDAWHALKATTLKVADLDYLLRHRDDAGTVAPAEADLLRDLKALRDGLTAVAADLAAPPANADLAYARTKLTLVYDAAVVDDVLGLIAGTTTYRAALVTTEETLPDTLSHVDARLGFDAFGKRLTYAGTMSAATAIALGAAADTLVLGDMSVITTAPELAAYVTAFKAAVQGLRDAGGADLDALGQTYPELKVVYDAVAPIADPAAQVQALIDHMLPALRQRLSALSLRATLTSQLKIDATLVDVLTEGAGVLHASGNAADGVLEDFLDLDQGVTFDTNQTYALHLDPPTTDDYIVYVAAPAGATVTLTIGTIAAIPATVAGASGEVHSANPVSLVAGALTAASLTLAGLPAGQRAELRWRTKGMAKTAVPRARVYVDTSIAAARASLIRLQKASTLLRTIAVTPRELRHLAAVNPETRGFLDAIDVDGTIGASALQAQWTRLSWLGWFGRLKEDEPDPDTWVSLFEQPRQLTPQGRFVLAAAAGWQDQDLTDVLGRLGIVLGNLASLQVFRRVWDAMTLVVETQQTAADLIAWTTASPDTALIATIKQRLRTRQTAVAWRDTLQSVNDPLRNLRRDALVAYILHHARPNPAIDTADKLYEHFLIDVAMDACMMTSRIRLALSSVQLFITRCLMNLEPDVAASAIRADQWAWMKRYRVWEANRKIFLYPENWLEPELRDGKSSFFTELESELLKSDITDELAEDAYLAYLKKLDEVARLEIMGSYLQQGEAGNQDDDILHVFGRTNGVTHQYYYRRFEYGYWTPWVKMTLNIEGDLLVPVIWKHQLFVFWLQAVPKPEGADSTKNPQTMGSEAWGPSAKVSVEFTICWGEYYKGKWASPKSSELKEPIRFSGLTRFEPEKIYMSARTEKPSPEISERLIMNVGYLGTPAKIYGVTFTSKNAPPRIAEQIDLTLFWGVDMFNYALLWQNQPSALLDANSLREPGKLFKVTIMQPNDAASTSLDENVFTKTDRLADGFRVRPLMQLVENQWEAPMFYADEQSLLFISPDEHVDMVNNYTGYFWNDLGVLTIPPDKFKIPQLYEQPVIPDKIGPVTKSLVELINPRYEQAISDNKTFTFGGTAFDAQGVAVKGVMR